MLKHFIFICIVILEPSFPWLLPEVIAELPFIKDIIGKAVIVKLPS